MTDKLIINQFTENWTICLLFICGFVGVLLLSFQIQFQKTLNNTKKMKIIYIF